MNEATHAQLERLTMTDGSVAFNVLVWDNDIKDSALRIEFMDEGGAQEFLDAFREKTLTEVLAETLEVSH